MTDGGLHEPRELLSDRAQDLQRAIRSLMEELEAVDWYGQRIEATTDAELRSILGHNRAEEIEHAAMVLEWIRRRHPDFDEELRARLFRDGPIVTGEDEEEEHPPSGGPSGGEASGGEASPGDGSLRIGSLRPAEERP